MTEPRPHVYIFRRFEVDGTLLPDERISVDYSGPVGTPPQWKCHLWLEDGDAARLDALGADGCRKLWREYGLMGVLDTFEWELTDHEQAAIDRFTRRGVAVVLPAVSQATRKLAQMTGTVGMELNLARSPVFTPGQHGDNEQLSLVVRSLDKPFTIMAPKGLLTVRDGLFLTEAITRFVRRVARDESTANRVIPMTGAEMSDAVGYSDHGTWQAKRLTEAIVRLRSTTITGHVRQTDGEVKYIVWGLVDGGFVSSRDEGRGQIRLSEELAGLVCDGLLAYYDRDILRALVDRDEYAARLWMFLEGESLNSTPRLYSIFSAPEGDPPAERDTPAIADLLGVSDWQRRRKAKDRVAKAAVGIVETDPRYTLSVGPAKRQTMWNLCVSKHHVPSGALVENKCTGRGAEVYDGGRKSVRPGAQKCTAGGATGEEIPARHESNEAGAVSPSVSPSVSSTVKEPDGVLSEQAESPLRCTPDERLDLLDPSGEVRAGIGVQLADILAAGVCLQVRNVTGCATCEARYRECAAALPAVGAKFGATIGTGTIANPHAYIMRAVREAGTDPAELLGETLQDAEARLERLRALDHGAPLPGAPKMKVLRYCRECGDVLSAEDCADGKRTMRDNGGAWVHVRCYYKSGPGAA